MSDKYVRAVAPDVETSDENDPRLERWHRCGHADIGGTRPDLYLMLSLLGGPPYRYYKLDMAGGRPKQEVIYTEAYRKGSEFAGTGETAYHWVDLDTCTLMGGAAVGNPLVVQNTPQKLPSRNVLVRYRATYLAVDLFEIGNTYEFRAQALDEESRHNGRYCAWKDVLKSSTPAK